MSSEQNSDADFVEELKENKINWKYSIFVANHTKISHKTKQNWSLKAKCDL